MGEGVSTTCPIFRTSLVFKLQTAVLKKNKLGLLHFVVKKKSFIHVRNSKTDIRSNFNIIFSGQYLQLSSTVDIR